MVSAFWGKTTPSGFATSPKYDDENSVCGFKVRIVVFGGGREGIGHLDVFYFEKKIAPDAG